MKIPSDFFDPKEAPELSTFQRNRRAANRKRARLMTHLASLLRPRVTHDPLLPALCEELTGYLEEARLLDLALDFARMGHESALHQFGPGHAQTRRARSCVRSLEKLIADYK